MEVELDGLKQERMIDEQQRQEPEQEEVATRPTSSRRRRKTAALRGRRRWLERGQRRAIAHRVRASSHYSRLQLDLAGQ